MMDCLDRVGNGTYEKIEDTTCIYCGEHLTAYCSDEEFRCEKHIRVWQFLPDGDEYV